MLKANQCAECGKPIEARFNVCYQCYTKRIAGFTNRCAGCAKPIDPKYTLCYTCNQKEKDKQ